MTISAKRGEAPGSHNPQIIYAGLFGKLGLSFVAGAAILLWSQAYGPENFFARAILSTSISVFAFAILTITTRNGEHMFGLVNCLFHISIFLVPATIQCARGWFPFFSKSYPDIIINNCSILILFYSIALNWAYLRACPDDLLRHSGPRMSRSTIHFGRFFALIPALFLVVSVSAAYLGLEWFTVRRGDLYLYALDLSPTLIFVQGLARNGAFLLFGITLIWWSLNRISPFRIALAAAGACIFLLFNNPLNTARFQFLSCLIAYAFLLAPSSRRWFKVSLSLGYLAGTLTLFPILNQLSRGIRGVTAVQSAFSYYAESGDFDGFQSVLNVVMMTTATGVGFGHRLLSALLAFVPRQVWAGKSEPTGAEAAKFAGYPFTNISAPAPAELYADFGVAGAVLGAALLGYALARADVAATEASTQGRPMSLLFWGTVAGFTTILLRGSLLAVIGPVGLAAALALAARSFSEVSSPHLSPSQFTRTRRLTLRRTH